jgi:hypothetical protein
VFLPYRERMVNDQTCSIELTEDEALVLFEFLQRISDQDVLRIEDPAERRALWNLACLLERRLAAPFRADYPSLLAGARGRLRDMD